MTEKDEQDLAQGLFRTLFDAGVSFNSNDLIPRLTATVRALGYEKREPALSLPDPKGGCACTPFSQDAGGGYTEHLLDYEPGCPEHSTHLYDPRSGEWVLRVSAAANDATAAVRVARAIFAIRDDPYDLDEWDDLDAAQREPYECQGRAAVAALAERETVVVDDETHECEFGCASDAEHLQRAYDAMRREFDEHRADRQGQMTRIRAALDDAYRGARTGNLITPPWVVQSIDDARAAGGWTLPPAALTPDGQEGTA